MENALLSTALKFNLSLKWPERLSVRSGDDWCALPDTELAPLLVLGRAAKPFEDLTLFNVPEHLRQSWWANAEAWMDPARKTAVEGAFARSFFSFTRFKSLPLDAPARIEFLVRPVEESEAEPAGRARAWVNFGDEEIAVTFPASAARPALRLRLLPGEGFLPPTGLAFQPIAVPGKAEVDVILAVREG